MCDCIRWFKCKLKPPKNTPLYNEVLQLGWLKRKEGEQKDPAASTSGATSSASKVGSAPPAKRTHQSLQTRKGQKALKPGEVNPADVLPASRLAPPPIDVMATASTPSWHILGKKPSAVPDYANNAILPVESQLFFGCANTREYLRLLEYLQINGEYKPVQVQRRGACQFASFCHGVDCPKEYTNTHLRRQLVMEIIKHKEFFFLILQKRIAMNYGPIRLTEEEYKSECADNSITAEQQHTYHEPEPFSFYTYLKYILNCSSWGDEITLVLLSMMFQVCATIVDSLISLSTKSKK